MKILSLDTSSRAASAALWEDDFLVGEFFLNAAITHSETILPLVDDLLRQARRSLEEVDLFAVASGPGSFTGIRIGIASVKGLAVGLDKPVLGVSTLLGLAHNLTQQKGLLIPALDARRETLYTAVFRSDGTSLTQIVEDSNIPARALGPLLVANRRDDEPVYLLGDGAPLILRLLGEEHPYLQLAPPALRYQRASGVGLAARELLQTEEPLSPAALEPRYLRITQAERERIEHQNAEKGCCT